MIGKIAGRVDYHGEDHVLIDTGGVGYIVYCSDRTRMALPGQGEAVALYTELVVREDLLQLYGFLTIAEREWHRLLTSVQGVGAKAALAILGTLGPEGIARAIALGDVASIKAAPGIGPKIAQRVANELKDKAPALMAMGSGASEPAAPVLVETDRPVAAPPVAAPASPGAQAEALSALANLGYAPGEAAAAVAQAAEDGMETPDLIREALKLLAPKG